MARTDVSNDRVAALVATELVRAAPDAIDETVTRAFAQVGLHLSAKSLSPKFSRISPKAGFKRLFSSQSGKKPGASR